jgi:hypothetical protein
MIDYNVWKCLELFLYVEEYMVMVVFAIKMDINLS